MHLVQLFLPLYDPAGAPFPQAFYGEVAKELTHRFGGLTAYTRAPVKGLWEPSPGHTERDDLVIYEVMVASLDAPWWAEYRRGLEARFQQQELLVRAQEVLRL